MKIRDVILFGFIIMICVFALVYVPKWQLYGEDIADTKERIELENRLRATLVQALGGAFLLIGIYFAWRRISATERALEISKSGQITERFTRAIDQLGATRENGEKKLEIRVGGIYALERIARDSAEDHWHVMEVLTAYVRENARLPDRKGMVKEKTETDDSSFTDIPTPPADIQTCLTVIGRRTLAYEKWYHRIWLTRTDLRGALLGLGLNFQNAQFTDANLQYARLMESDFRDAIFLEANLENTVLVRADFRGAFFEKANLQGANLWQAKLEGAKGLTIDQVSQVRTLFEATGLNPMSLT